MKIQKALRTSISFGLLCSASLFVNTAHAETQSLILAGGCFWCVESDFEKVPGVISAESGYIGGYTKSPTYRSVSSKNTGHYEAVKILFDDTQVSLEDLSHYFWRTIDPTDPSGQFCDKGSPYKTAMFYQDDQQRAVFEASLAQVEATKPFTNEVVTELLPASTFYSAEEYHQDYYKKNPIRYNLYRSSCGRDRKIEDLWGEVASEAYH